MHFEFELTSKECDQVQSAALRQQYAGSQSRVKFWLVMLLLIVVLAYRFVTEIVRQGGLIWILVFVVVWIFMFLRLRSRKKAHQRGTTTVDVESEGLRFADSGGLTFLKWQLFTEVIERDSLLILAAKSSPGVKAFFGIPERAFANSSERQQFIETVESLMSSEEIPAELEQEFRSDIAPVSRFIRSGKSSAQGMFQFRWRDGLTIAISSWTPRLAMLLVLIIIPFGIRNARQNMTPEDAMRTNNLALVLFMAAFLLVFFCMVLGIFAYKEWSRNPARRVPVEIIVSETGIETRNTDTQSQFSWSQFSYYKETSRAFILWSSGSSRLFIPKRTFGQKEQEFARGIIAAKLRPSAWFFG